MADEREWETEALPPCKQCNVAYRLVGIEATDSPHHDLYTYECPSCGHIETRTVHAK